MLYYTILCYTMLYYTMLYYAIIHYIRTLELQTCLRGILSMRPAMVPGLETFASNVLGFELVRIDRSKNPHDESPGSRNLVPSMSGEKSRLQNKNMFWPNPKQRNAPVLTLQMEGACGDPQCMHTITIPSNATYGDVAAYTFDALLLVWPPAEMMKAALQ